MTSTAGSPAAAPAPTTGPVASVRYPQPWSRVFGAGLYGTVVAMLAVTVVYWVMRLAGVPMEAARGSTGAPALVGWGEVLGATLLAGVVACVVGGLFRRSPRGPRIVALVGTVAYLVSLAAPVWQPSQVPTSTRLCLIVLHTLVYAIVVWFVARGVTPEDPPAAAKTRFDIA